MGAAALILFIMKTFIKITVPLMTFALAGTGALKAEAIRKSPIVKPLMIGYVHGANQNICIPVSVDCTPTASQQICMTNEATPRQVWGKNVANLCVLMLYKTPQ